MDKRRRQVKGGIHYTRGVIQANSNILWTCQFSDNVSDHDEQNPVGPHQHCESGKFY